MLSKFKYHLKNNFPFLRDKKLFLATSGGLDSMVLIHLMHQLNFQIAVLHCNFKLRGVESDGDEAFVKSVCTELKIPFFVKKFDTQKIVIDQKLSIQVAARNLRYAWFNEQLSEQNYDYLLTAHHLDDNLETFLINFLRGTGIDGLTGIPAQNQHTIRPLLPFSRDEILALAKENNIAWREDSSNASTKYVRNKLRLDAIPKLKEIQPQLLLNFQNTLNNLNQVASLASEASNLLYKNVVTEHQNGIEINLQALMQSTNYQAYLYSWLKKYDFTAWQDVYQLVAAETGKKVFAKNHVLLKNRTSLFLFENNSNIANDEFYIVENQNHVKYPINLSFSEVAALSISNSNTIFVDKNELHFPLSIRKCKADDLFYPFGFKGKKKLTQFFKDIKLSTSEKNNIWLLVSNERIVWVINHRMDDRFRISESTKLILRITTSQ